MKDTFRNACHRHSSNLEGGLVFLNSLHLRVVLFPTKKNLFTIIKFQFTHPIV